MSVAVGARILHDGEEDFQLHEIVDSKGIRIARFGNKGRRVTCNAAELVFIEEDDAWYLPGRLLSREQRIRFARMVGSPTLPDDHVAARKVLKAADAL